MALMNFDLQLGVVTKKKVTLLLLHLGLEDRKKHLNIYIFNKYCFKAPVF